MGTATMDLGIPIFFVIKLSYRIRPETGSIDSFFLFNTFRIELLDALFGRWSNLTVSPIASKPINTSQGNP